MELLEYYKDRLELRDQIQKGTEIQFSSDDIIQQIDDLLLKIINDPIRSKSCDRALLRF